MEQTRIIKPLLVAPIDGNNWVLLDDYVVYSGAVKNIIAVKKGFVTDFESIPRYLFATYSMTFGKAKWAAVPHDWIYRTHIYDKKTSDLIFKELMEVCFKLNSDLTIFKDPEGNPEQLLNAWEKFKLYKSVDLFGGTSYKEGPVKLLEQNQEIFKEYFPQGYRYKTLFKKYNLRCT